MTSDVFADQYNLKTADVNGTLLQVANTTGSTKASRWPTTANRKYDTLLRKGDG